MAVEIGKLEVLIEQAAAAPPVQKKSVGLAALSLADGIVERLQLARASGDGPEMSLLQGEGSPVRRVATRKPYTLGGADRYEAEAESNERKVYAALLGKRHGGDGPSLAATRGAGASAHRAPLHGAGGPAVAGSGPFQRDLERARASGSSLPGDVRIAMERSFGRSDLSSVRVHADGLADSLNRSLEARAFTLGRDIFFRSGEYDPSSPRGRALLAHELTHVLQQSDGTIRPSRVPVAIRRSPFSPGSSHPRRSSTGDALAIAADPLGALCALPDDDFWQIVSGWDARSFARVVWDGDSIRDPRVFARFQKVLASRPSIAHAATGDFEPGWKLAVDLGALEVPASPSQARIAGETAAETRTAGGDEAESPSNRRALVSALRRMGVRGASDAPGHRFVRALDTGFIERILSRVAGWAGDLELEESLVHGDAAALVASLGFTPGVLADLASPGGTVVPGPTPEAPLADGSAGRHEGSAAIAGTNRLGPGKRRGASRFGDDDPELGRIYERILALEGKEPGVSLDISTKYRLEGILGHELGEVRLHQGPLASKLARATEAEALTVGSDIYIPRALDLSSPEGLGLLVHEATHVAQVAPATPRSSPRSLGGGSSGEVMEDVARSVEARFRRSARPPLKAFEPVHREDPGTIPFEVEVVPAPAKTQPVRPAGSGPRSRVRRQVGGELAQMVSDDVRSAFSKRELSKEEFLELCTEKLMNLMRDELLLDSERRETVRWSDHRPSS